ncbi:MAG: signal peptidase I, partial [Alphaproteobacteria bacterium]|nr:signal peptidase I [Alphaproteobacteria bacterium]
MPIALIVSVSALVIGIAGWTPFGVYSSTMLPNLAEGEFLFLEKPTGLRRGDIIAFYAPKGGPWGPHVEFLQRVVGLPGDRIEMKNGVLFVNGAPAMQTFKGEDRFGFRRAIRL